MGFRIFFRRAEQRLGRPGAWRVGNGALRSRRVGDVGNRSAWEVFMPVLRYARSRLYVSCNMGLKVRWVFRSKENGVPMTKTSDSRFLDCKKGNGIGLEKSDYSGLQISNAQISNVFLQQGSGTFGLFGWVVDYVGKPALFGVRHWRANGYFDRVGYECKYLNIWEISMKIKAS